MTHPEYPKQVFDTESTPISYLMLLEASAGTGKTYALERIVARLINPPPSSPHPPMEIREILVVTFTNRAAREMKERIRTLLLQLCEENTSADSVSRYRRAISDFHKAPIYTIHGFCKMILSTWPVESDSPFSQELAANHKLEYSLLRSWLSGFNNIQLNNPLAYHAIRSFGSVENTIESIGEKLTEFQEADTQVKPEKTILREFTDFLESANIPGNPLDKALQQLCTPKWSLESMKELIYTHLNKKKQKPGLLAIQELLASTSHTIPAPAFPADNKNPEKSTILPDLQSEPAAPLFAICRALNTNKHLQELFIAGIALESASTEICLKPETRQLATAISNVHKILRKWLDISDGGKIKNTIETWCRLAFISHAEDKLQTRIREHKDRKGLFNYNDLIQRVSEKLAIPTAPLKQVLRRNFRAALIDEFQDTDENQWTIFSTLFGQKGCPLVLIGDPKQSIYRFRGTNLQTYNKACKKIPRNNHYLLNTNYRSTPTLVKLTNTLFTPLFCNPDYKPVKPGKKIDKTLVWNNDSSPLTLLESQNRGEAAGTICCEIRRMLDPQTGACWYETDSRQTVPINAADIVVLCRTITEEQEILQGLKELAIPAFTIRTKSVLEDQPLLYPLFTLLAALENPMDYGLWKAVLLDEFFLLTPQELLEFEQEKGIKRLGEEGTYWHETFERGHATLALEAVLEFASEINRIPWPRRILSAPDGERKWTDFSQIMELIQARQFEDYHNRSISAIRQWLDDPSATMDAEDTKILRYRENDIPAVRVMTMHMAKGLEFPLVFIHAGYTRKTQNRQNLHPEYRFAHANRPVIDRLRRPENWELHLAEEWEEAKRLWYVAITRASHKVWIPHVITGSVNQLESLLFLSLSGKVTENKIPGSETATFLPPHECIEKKNTEAFREELKSHIESSPRIQVTDKEEVPLISVKEASALEQSTVSSRPVPLPKPPAPHLELAPLPANPAAERDPVTSSYSSLLRAATQGDSSSSNTQADYTEDADRDSARTSEHAISVDPFPVLRIESPVQKSSKPGIPAEKQHQDSGKAQPDSRATDNSLDTARGTLFGSMIHKILEKCPFDAAGNANPENWYNDSELDKLFQNICSYYYPVSWYPSHRQALKHLVRTVLRSPVPNLGRLCDIPSSSRRPELEFHILVPNETRLNAAGLEEVRIFPGFLKGFIDLVIHYEGHWWILDWKTNLPEDEQQGGQVWDPGLIELIMDKHHYNLQYELYLLALCCDLSRNRTGRPLRWDEEVGGAIYLFVRGMNERNASGIFVNKPENSRMQYLAESLGLEGIIE